MRDPKVVLITGASSGIGEALALEYARPGTALILQGRDTGRLEGVAARAAALGAAVRCRSLDVTDRAGMAEWLAAEDARTPIDLVIANAGVAGGGKGGGEPETRRIFAVNLDGVLNTVHPLLPAMTRRGRGQIALMSSLAGFHGFARSPAYCAAKAAVRLYGEGLRGALKTEGVEVSVICPGFVRTPMTAGNPFPMPLMVEADRAARLIARGLARNRGRIVFPWPLYLAVRLLGALPPALTARLAERGRRAAR